MAAPNLQRTAVLCAAVVVAMVGMAYASVPLYELFCRTTGYGGTTRTGQAAPQVADRMIRVMFDANVDPKLDWVFEPDQPYIDVKLGEVSQISYHARNKSDHRITGSAVYNVTPYALGVHFSKIQCFCFNEQTLEPGQDIHMPVIFYVDPAMEQDRTAHAIRTATLSYTFYETPSSAATNGAAAR